MKNKSVSSSNKGFAGWIEDFITGLANKEANLKLAEEVKEEEKEEIVAEINLNDLDKVVWKEESFGVHFDEKGASLINEFGNVVRTLQDCKTVEEVDKQLNGKEIVVANNEEEKEEDLKEELNKIADALWEENGGMTNITPEHVEAPQGGNTDVQPPQQPQEQPVVASTEEKEEEDDVITAIADGFEQLESIVAKMNKRLALVEQQYARNPESQDVSDNSQEEEVKHFTESADETSKEIEHEHAVDITSPNGRVELSNEKCCYETSEIENIVTQDVEVKEQPEEVELEKSPEDEEKDLGEKEVEKLSGVAERIFQKGVCPETGEELIKSKTVGDFVGVYSTAGTEYAVNLKTGSIYKYLKRD